MTDFYRWSVMEHHIGAATAPGTLHKDAQDRLARLRLPRFTRIGLPDLCLRAGDMLGREIQLVPMKLPDQVTGMWLSTSKGADYIAFEKRAAPDHQAAVVRHEIAHVLCGHQSGPVIDLDAIRSLWPALNPSMVQGVLGRDHSDTPAERQAEYLGTVLASRTRWTADLTSRMSGDPGILALAERLSMLFTQRS
ncbi:hypothetical protein CFP71_40695 [Amycolatopsis thailandensis]|uniref:IrrE N-terminal-like domain-containing protein n=1 Tax=Amycolatopsis thailandensis TaxID=589330 RepID=A0A229RCG6_9PSEU|nr:hypothetical protein [Amycolatopsis thailandensis]OXM44275.1 hypothetical protein CFP71_40695 [Amycolatopsis thailandensis]